MFTQTTPLYLALGSLKGPLTADFDPAAWAAVAGENPHPDDQRLLRSALWIAEQAMTIRERSGKADLLSVGGRQAAILAVAAMNREMLIVLDEQEQSRHQDVSGMAFDHIVSQPKFKTRGGAMASADDLIEITIGSSESWIFDAYAQPVEGEPSPYTVENLIASGGRIYSLQRNHTDFWNQARWDGWGLNPSLTRWEPFDKAFSTLEDSWRARTQANSTNHAMLVVTDWKHLSSSQRRALALKRTVETIQRTAKGLKVKVGRPTEIALRKPAHYALDKATLEGSYLADLADEDFPTVPGLNANLLLKAWHVLTDLAHRLMVGLDDRQIAERLEDFALLVPRPTVVAMLASALEVDSDLADRITDFLTYRTKLPNGKGQRGLWAAPVVEIPGTDKVGLSAPALISSFLLRKVEAWFERGGLDDRQGKLSRGERLERIYRERLASKVADNKSLTQSVVAPYAIKKTKAFPQQIDLMFRLGDLLVVAEVKHRLFPSDSMERYNYFQNLKGAAQQAKIKAQAISDFPDVAAAALGLSLELVENLRVIPLVVVNQGFGLSLEVNGVRVTETAFLKSLLGSPTIVTGMSFDQFTQQRIFAEESLYSSEADLVARFEAILADPYVLRRYIDRMGWRTYEFPQAGGGSILVDAPLLGDVAGEELHRAMRARSAFEVSNPRPRGRGRWRP